MDDNDIMDGLRQQFSFSPEEAVKELENWQSSKINHHFFFNRQNYQLILKLIMVDNNL